jgi:hypothetical protein
MSLKAYQTRPDGCIVSFMQQDDTTQFLSPPSYSADFIEWSNHASALFVTGHTDLALIAARRALLLERTPTTLLNLAVILETQSEYYSAFPLAEEAHRINPNHPFAACFHSDDLLRMGRLSEAWPLYSDSHADWSLMRRVLPEWNGRTSIRGRRILVLSGGGYGDDILFLRWMPRLKSYGANVTYLCPPALSPLLARAPYIDHFLPGSVAGFNGSLLLSSYDLFTCIRSLAAHFCPTVEDIPTIPYIHATEARSLYSRNGLRQCASHLIGLCTRAGEESFPRRHRSLLYHQVLRIVRTPLPHDTQWVSLDYDKRSIVDGILDPPMNDWADTATILAMLDLVITVDTGVAHLAGAMGIPCWVLLPGFSAAYYGVSGERNLFYPSHRLFRNGGEGIDYSVDAVCAALQEAT